MDGELDMGFDAKCVRHGARKAAIPAAHLYVYLSMRESAQLERVLLMGILETHLAW